MLRNLTMIAKGYRNAKFKISSSPTQNPSFMSSTKNKDSYAENFNNLKLLMKITNTKVKPITEFNGNKTDQTILAYMTQVRKWTFTQLPSFTKNNNQKLVKEKFFSQFQFNLPNNETLKGIDAYAKLFNYKEDVSHLTADDVILSKIERPGSDNALWDVTMKRNPSRKWNVETKLALTEAEMLTVATLLHDSNIPNGKSVQLQADAHIAGSYTWIGMVASFDCERIPFVTVSADIGCGMSLLPLVRDNTHVAGTSFSEEEMKATKLSFMLNARQRLYRGRKANEGDGSNVMALMSRALNFFDGAISLQTFSSQLLEVFDALEIDYNNAVNDGAIDGLNVKQSRALNFATKFGQSLGSSGNHFIELAQSNEQLLFAVIHSGSRGLGAAVYKKISELNHIYASNNIAQNELAVLYTKAFSVLCQYAQLNRILCGLAVLEPMNYSIDGKSLKDVMVSSPMFSHPNLSVDQKTRLLFGLTHNGIKAFCNEDSKEVIFVLSKGSIVLSQHSDIGIVALRAGDGCDVFVLANAQAKWRELSIYEAKRRLTDRSAGGVYSQIFDLSKTDLLFAGHGAGRTGSARKTRDASSYSDMIAYYHSQDFVGNLSPNVLGDNPRIAYKAPDEIRQQLPTKEAVFYTTLRTLVNHKEGIDFGANTNRFADFCLESYDAAADDMKLWYDVGLARSGHASDKSKQNQILEMFSQQEELITRFMTDPIAFCRCCEAKK